MCEMSNIDCELAYPDNAVVPQLYYGSELLKAGRATPPPPYLPIPPSVPDNPQRIRQLNRFIQY